MLDERVVDLPMREADVAIRLKEPSQADLIRRRLMDVRMRFYASEDYIGRNGLPATAEELMRHRIIGHAPDSPQVAAGQAWLRPFLDGDHPSHLTVNNYFGILQSVIHGLGIGALPDYVTNNQPDLVNVVPSQASGVVPVYLAYPEELRHSKRVAAFRDFILAEIAAYKRAQREAAEAAS